MTSDGSGSGSESRPLKAQLKKNSKNLAFLHSKLFLQGKN
jgi:hypothetical protein